MTAADDVPTPHCPITPERRASKSQKARCLERQRDEIQALEAIFPGQVHAIDPADFPLQDNLSAPSRAFRVHLKPLHPALQVSPVEIDLFVVFGELYPLEPPRLSVKGELDNEPRIRIWELIERNQGRECMYDVCQFLLNSLQDKLNCEENLWEAYHKRKKDREEEEEKRRETEKLELEISLAMQKQKLQIDVEDLQKRNNALLASPKIPTLDFLPIDPDCDLFPDPFSPILGSPAVSVNKSLSPGQKSRCMSSVTDSNCEWSEPLRSFRGFPTLRSSMNIPQQSPRSDARSRRFNSAPDDLEISRRFRSSSSSVASSCSSWANFEMAEEEWTPRRAAGQSIPFTGIATTEQRTKSAQHSRYAEDFEEKCALGEGAFGFVTKVRHLIDKQLYAVKRIAMPNSRSESNKILQEVSMFPRLFHRHVVRYYQAWIEHQVDATYLFMQMEYCSGQSLLNAIESGHLHTDHGMVWRLFRQIVDAVYYLHDNDILHRDLKPANIFLDRERSDAKVGDFGLSRYRKAQNDDEVATADGSNSKRCLPIPTNLPITIQSPESIELSREVGTALYSAPEVSTTSYDEKSDVWSLGVVFFEMFHSPFSTRMQRVNDISALPYDGPPADWGAPPNALDILSRMVCFNPKERFSARELRASELLPALTENPDQDVTERIIMTLKNPMSIECGMLLHAVSQRAENLAKKLAYTKDWFQTSCGYSARLFSDVCLTHQATCIELPILCVRTEVEQDVPYFTPIRHTPLAQESTPVNAAPPAPTSSHRFVLFDTQCNTMTYLRPSLIFPFRDSSVRKTDEHTRLWHVGSVYSRRLGDAYGHPVARSAGILGFWDRKVPPTSERYVEFKETVSSHIKEILFAALEVLSGRRIELRLCWPWVLPELLGVDHRNEWIARESRKGKKETRTSVTNFINAQTSAKIKYRVIENAIDSIQSEAIDIIHKIRPDSPYVKEALEVIELVSPFVDKVYIDPLCEGLDDEEGFENFFFVCRSSAHQHRKSSVFCKGGCISNDSHVGSIVQFSLEKLDFAEQAPPPRVFVAFHPNSQRFSTNSLTQVAALFWRQPMQCEVLKYHTEQEIRQEIKTKMMRDAHREDCKTRAGDALTNFLPVLVLVRESDGESISYSHRAVSFKVDREKVTKLTLEREDIYDSTKSVVNAVKHRHLHPK
eukprot:GEMP01000881.1.p1 GENE.GEMP01000881.1~~GEMP01000881.1.p1  ORF type:complete len:1169 (+),score=211.84 GEMP01000881.1:91-3597(+)